MFICLSVQTFFFLAYCGFKKIFSVIFSLCSEIFLLNFSISLPFLLQREWGRTERLNKPWGEIKKVVAAFSFS